MNKYVLVLCGVFLLSCRSNVICPAFQSTYILDDSVRATHFSYVWQLDEVTRQGFLSQDQSTSASGLTATYSGFFPDDSSSFGTSITRVEQPKTDYYAYAEEHSLVTWRSVKKTKYGIVKNSFYPIKNYRMKTAPMKNVLPPKPISDPIETGDFYDSDSAYLTGDSLLLATSVSMDQSDEKSTPYLYFYDPKDDFNVEQEYYNKYFGDKFIDNGKSETDTVDSAENIASDTTTKKPFFDRVKDFFRFGKKSKNDSTDSFIDQEAADSILDDA